MSSTRTPVRPGAPDFYETPEWVTRLIVPTLGHLTDRILEPAAGNGAIVKVLEERTNASVMALDIRLPAEQHCQSRILVQDFLTWETQARFPLIITNPPYNQAMEFLEKALTLLPGYGEVVLLLRLAFLESQKRAAFLREHAPDVLVLPRRPSFTGGGTDSAAYAWFKFYHGRRWSGQVRVLDDSQCDVA